MDAEDWQISSYCQEGNSCVGLRAMQGQEISLRESAEPGVELVATPGRVAGLLAAVRRGDLPAGER